MGLFKKFKGKSKGDRAKADREVDQKPTPEAQETGTVLRQPDKATPITKEKERVELTALEIAEQQDWEVKTLPVWKPGDLILDTYELEDVISGGMGHVYIANHSKWNIKLAIKSPNEMMLSDRSNFARILREANSWIELGLHPNIAYCYYVRNIEDIPHIFVEYVDGGNLRQWIEDGKCIDYRTSMVLAIQFCHGMEHAHSKGMIHRDIKPENILMTQDGVLKITDFGLVRGGDSLQAEDPSIQKGSNEEDSSLTVVGAEMGTWGYMSPEQKENPHDVDERTDIFSFGICLYEMFCGNRPYEISFGPDQKPPDPVRLSGEDNFPLKLAEVLKKCVQWNSTDRYLNFDAIRKELSSIYIDLYSEQCPFEKIDIAGLEADRLNNLGVSYWELKQYKKARNCFHKVLEIESFHPEANFNLGSFAVLDVLIKHSDWQEKVIGLLRNLVEKFGESSEDIETRIQTALKNEKFIDGFAKNFEGHSDHINSVCFSPDRNILASGSSDRCIKLWDVDSKVCIDTLKGHTDRVATVCYSPDGRILASGSSDRSIRLWDTKSNNCASTLKGHTDRVTTACFSPDGRILASGSLDRTIRLWDTKSNSCVDILKGHTDGVTTVCYSPDGRILASGSLDRSIRLWDAERGELFKKLDGHSKEVTFLMFSPDGNHLASGSLDKTILVWSLKINKVAKSFKEHRTGVKSFSFSSDGKLLASGTFDKSIRLWDFESGKILNTFDGHQGGINTVVFSPNGKTLTSGSTDKTIRLWPAEFIPQLAKIPDMKELKAKQIGKIREFEQLQNLISSGKKSEAYQKTIDLWKKETFKVGSLYHSTFNRLIEQGKYTGMRIMPFKVLSGHQWAVNSVSFSPDGKIVASASDDRTVKLWNVSDGQLVKTYKEHDYYVNSVAFSPDGQLIASGSRDKTARICELRSGKLLGSLIGHKKSVNSVSFSPDGKLLASGGSGERIRIWDVKNYQVVEELDGEGECVSVEFSNDGKNLLAVYRFWIDVWDLERFKKINNYSRNRYKDGTRSGFIGNSSFSAKFVPPNRLIVMLRHDTLRLWNYETDEIFWERSWVYNYPDHLSISPDGKVLACYSSTGSIILLKGESGENFSSTNWEQNHEGDVNCLAFSPNNLFLASGSDDKAVRIWLITPELSFNNESYIKGTK